jgi:hypothetical protein
MDVRHGKTIGQEWKAAERERRSMAVPLMPWSLSSLLGDRLFWPSSVIIAYCSLLKGEHFLEGK